MSDEQPIKSKKYHAFISYRHADNKESGRQWATWLHQALETYEVPTELVGKTNGRGETIPSRIYPVFRDEQELPADADLGSSIKQALEQTNVLVVLCSPQAVASTYVAEEIDYFKKLGNSERIIAAMIDGEPNASWDSGKQELGFTAKDECFPKPLQVKYDDNGLPTQAHAEPIAADFRINNDGTPEQGWTSPEAYKQHLTASTELDSDTIEQKVSDYQQQQKLMLLKIVAGILGIPLGELTQRDKEYQLAQERLRAKKLRRWVSALFILTILAIAAGGYAYMKQQEAEKQTVIAEQKTIEAQAQTEIAEQKKAEAQAQTIEANHNYALALNEKAIQAEKERNIEYAKLYALHALKNTTPSQFPIESTSIISQYGEKSDLIFELKEQHQISSYNFSFDSKFFLTGDIEGNINLYNLLSGEKYKISTGSKDSIDRIIFSSDGKLFASLAKDVVDVFSTDNKKKITQLKKLAFMPSDITFSPENTNIIASDGKLVEGWDFDGKKVMVPKEVGERIRIISSFDNDLSHFGWLIWDKSFNFEKLIKHPYERDAYTFQLSISNDAKYIIHRQEGQYVQFWDTSHDEELRSIDLSEHSGNVQYITEKKTFAIDENGKITLWNKDLSKVIEIIKTETWSDFIFSHDEKILAIINRNKISFKNVDFKNQIKVGHGYPDTIDILKFYPRISNILFAGNYGAELQQSPLFDIQSNKRVYANIYVDDSKKERYLAINDEIVEKYTTLNDNMLTPLISYWYDRNEKELRINNNQINAYYKLKIFERTGADILTKSSDSILFAIEQRERIEVYGLDNVGKLSFLCDLDKGSSAISFVNDSSLLVSHKDNKNGVSIIDVYNCEESYRINEIDPQELLHLIFMPDNKHAISLSEPANTVEIWELSTGKRIMKFSMFKYIQNIVFSPDGRWFLGYSNDGTISFADMELLFKILVQRDKEKILFEFEKQSLLSLDGLKIVNKSNTFSQPIYPKTHPFHWLPLAEKGDANAMLQLGIIEHRDSHWKKAKEWYEKARDAGNTDAEERLRILALTKQYAEEEKTTQDSD